MPAPETILAKRAIELPSVALSVPDAIATEAGKETAFAITLDSEDGLPPRSIITIRGLPEGTSFSAGRPFGDTEWSLRPDETDNLRVTLPTGASGQRALSVAVVAADGSVITSAGTMARHRGRSQDGADLAPGDAARIAELIEHGRKMVEVGYFPGARLFPARGGSRQRRGGVLGRRHLRSLLHRGDRCARDQADTKQARIWYERAKALGHKDADAQIRALAKAEALAATPAVEAPR